MIYRGWEVINEFGSSVVALSKQISDDEDVFVSFKADMQSDITIPEDVSFWLLVLNVRRSLWMLNFSSRCSRMWARIAINQLKITTLQIPMVLIFK